MADTADLPEIYVMVGDAGVALLADTPHDLDGNYLVINKKNVVSLMERRSLAPIIRRRDYREARKSKVVL